MLITVETDISNGLPGFELVGYLSSSVREARERVRSALKNSGCIVPSQKVTVNLSPADVKKSGTGFDLAIAVSVLISMEIIPQNEILENSIFLGELSLDGRVLPVPGVLPVVHHAYKQGMKTVYVPKENVREAELIQGLTVIGVSKMKDVIEHFLYGVIVGWENDRCEEDGYEEDGYEGKGGRKAEGGRKGNDGRGAGNGSGFGTDEIVISGVSEIPDFADIRGQESAKRGMMIAAAGFHNILMTGEAGSGKSMMAKAMPGILPRMTYGEMLELTKIYSVAGMLRRENALMDVRPYRAPHYTISETALIGGSDKPKPGEVSLSSGGVLFLDEFPHFKRSVIEALRQPLEDRRVTISRVKATYTYPAKFMLVAARNNCPCGFYPDQTRCSCTWREIISYQNRISHPVMDRIDIKMEIKKLTYDEMFKSEPGTGTAEMRDIVERARERQARRYRDENWNFNSQIPQNKIDSYIKISDYCSRLLRELYNSTGISARGYFKVMRLIRTIADINDREEIHEEDVHEALFYRNETITRSI